MEKIEPLPLKRVKTEEKKDKLSRKKKKIVVVEASELVDSEARDVAEAKIAATFEKPKGVTGFVRRLGNKIWTQNLMYEYYRQKEIAAARQKIIDTGNVYANETADSSYHQQAMQAISERFISEYDEAIHREAGEERVRLGEKTSEISEDDLGKEQEIKSQMRELITRYAQGILNDLSFVEEKNRIFSSLRGVKKEVINKGVLYADNLLEVAKQARHSIEQGERLEELDMDFEVIIGRAKTGVRTEAQFNSIDKIAEKIHNARLGKIHIGHFVNEATVASALSIAYSLGGKFIQSGARSRLLMWGSFGLTALLGSGIAGVRESKRIEEERRQHFREAAQGKKFNLAKQPRRKEMEQFRYETKEARDLIDALEGVLYISGEDGKKEIRELTQEEFEKALANLADIESRIKLSDRQKIDLVGYSDSRIVEQERLRLDIVRAKAKVDLRKALDKGTVKVPEFKKFDDFLNSLTETRINQLIGGDKGIERKNELFKKMKNKKSGIAALKGLVIGLGVGIAVQEAVHYAKPFVGGFFEGVAEAAEEVKGAVGGVIHYTPLEYLKHWWSGDLPKVGSNITHEVLLGNNHVQLPEGIDLIKSPDGSYNLTRGDEIISKNISFKADGTLTEEAKKTLMSQGILTSSSVQSIIKTFEEEVTLGPREFIDTQEGLTTKIKRVLWYDNDTPKPVFDKNELKLWWGGESGTGIDSNGNFVYNIKHMTADGSFHSNFSLDAQKLMKEGKLKVLLSLSQDTQNQVFEIPIDSQGNAIIDPASEVGKAFFKNIDGKAQFLGKFVEIGEVVPSVGDGIERVRILATGAGKGVEAITSIIPKTVIENITNTHFNIPSDYQVDPPPFIPIIGRKPLESPVRQTPQPVPTNPPLFPPSPLVPPLVAPPIPPFPIRGGGDIPSNPPGVPPVVSFPKPPEQEKPTPDIIPPPVSPIVPPIRGGVDFPNEIEKRPALVDPVEMGAALGYLYGGGTASYKRSKEKISLKLQESPGSRLDHFEEIENYTKSFSPEYRAKLEDLANQFGSMSDKNRVSLCIPVAGHQEGKNIYKSLKNYTYQTANTELYELVLLVNHPEKDKNGNKVQPDTTLDEIKRFQDEHPHINVKVAYTILPIEQAKIGVVRKLLNDSTLVRHHSRGKEVPDLLMVSNDADNEGVAPHYIENFIRKYDDNQEVDGLLGQLDWDPESYAKYPLVHVGTRLFQYLSIIGRRRTGRLASSGANFSFRSSIYAAIGGYASELEGGEDVELGRAIVNARGTRKSLGFAGANVSRVYTSSRRAVKALEQGLAPIEQWNQGFSAFDDEVRRFELDQGVDINYNDPTALAQLKKGFEQILNRTLNEYEAGEKLGKGHPFYRKAIGWLGVKYTVDSKGDISITDMTALIEGLKEYQEYGVSLRDMKSGKESGQQEFLSIKQKQEELRRTKQAEFIKQLEPKIQQFYANDTLTFATVRPIANRERLVSSSAQEIIGDYVRAQNVVITNKDMSKVYPALKRGEENLVIIKESPVDKMQELARQHKLPADVMDVESYLHEKGFSHPNVLTCQNRFTHNDQVLRVYEVGTTDLERYLRVGNNLSLSQALSIMIRVGEGLSSLHKAGVAHTDVALSNIILTQNDIKLGDLDGASIDATGKGHFSRSFSGGNRFIISPEMFQERPRFGKTVDVYQAGATLYRLVAGKWPYDLESQTKGLPPEERMEKYRKVHELGIIDFPPNIPAGLRTVIKKAMNPSPAARYQSMDEFVSDLIDIQREALSEAGKT